MPQIHVPPDKITSSLFSFSGPEARHALLVLRKKAGDEIDIFDGQGNQYRALLTHADPKEMAMSGRILFAKAAASPRPVFRLFQGLPKGSKFDYVIEKATELGVSEITPVLSEKSVFRLDGDRAGRKRERWKKCAKAAAKQCGREDIPAMGSLASFAELKALLKNAQTLVFQFGACSRSLKEVLEREKILPPINVVIGPESGFSGNELRFFSEAGGIFVQMGSLVLRTETAGLAALAVLNYFYNSVTRS